MSFLLFVHSRGLVVDVSVCGGGGVLCEQSRAGGFYGSGVYLAERAAYCHENFAYHVPRTQLRKQLIYARVVVGREHECGTDTEPTLTKPPTGCHSVVGGPHKFDDDSVEASRMCVVYDNAQVYPQYIVDYEKGS